MAPFTITLSDNLLQLLDEKSKKLAIPKNQLIVRAIIVHLDQLNRAEYVKSYKQMAEDTDLMDIAEEGMEDFLDQLIEK